MKRSILLADDSPTIQRLVKQTFAGANYDIVSVSNGDAAIKKFPELRPHLVLADVYMPGRNGYEVCAYIKKQTDLPQTPVVLLVGAFDAFDADTAASAGAAAHITKPFEPQALLDLVDSLLPEVLPEEPAPQPVIEEDPLSLPQLTRIDPDETALSLPGESPADASASGMPLTLESASTVSVATAPDARAETAPMDDDLLGLGDLFHAEHSSTDLALSDDQMDRLVDRVIKKLSTQVIEGVAWDVVPGIAEKVLKETLKKQA